MKTQIIRNIKILTAILVVFIIITSCGKKEKNTSKKETISEIKVKAPKTDIHTATFIGDVKTIKQHIAAGTNLNQKDQYGSTPLTIAATFGKTEVAKVLIDGGADLNLKNNEGSTPLHVAAFFCRPEIVESLLANGADKTIRNNFGSTALESVSAPFKDVKVVYEQLGKQLGSLGLKLDFDYLEKTRPEIAEMLK